MPPLWFSIHFLTLPQYTRKNIVLFHLDSMFKKIYTIQKLKRKKCGSSQSFAAHLIINLYLQYIKFVISFACNFFLADIYTWYRLHDKVVVVTLQLLLRVLVRACFTQNRSLLVVFHVSISFKMHHHVIATKETFFLKVLWKCNFNRYFIILSQNLYI